MTRGFYKWDVTLPVRFVPPAKSAIGKEL